MTETTDREAGFYWVRVNDGEVTVGQKDAEGYWSIVGSDEQGTASAVEVLSNRLEQPS